MLAFQTYDISTILLLILLGIAMWGDIRTHKIPNKLNLLILVLGLSLQTWFLGLDGLVSGLLGLSVGFAIFIPFYLLKGFGAGDVKLMAVVGTFLGPENTFFAACFSLIMGGVIGIVVLIVKRGLGSYLSRYWITVKTFFTTKQLVFFRPEEGEAAAMRFPYASAIAMGTLSALYWAGMMNLSGVRDLFVLWIG